ncbi:MAG: hypothetical protein AB1696_04945 [Planctomycetota bacterium]
MQGQEYQPRTIEDRLREEYENILPDMRKVVDELETEVNHCLLPLKRTLADHEQVVVTSRIKACERAIDALERRQEGNVFDYDRAGEYSLLHLRDLAGVRVLVFPRHRIEEVKLALQSRFPDWEDDPIRDEENGKKILAHKFYGHCEASAQVCAEYQIVPMLLGLFWQVEHDTIYKPTSPELLAIARSPEMANRTSAVIIALEQFAAEFDLKVHEQRTRVGNE